MAFGLRSQFGLSKPKGGWQKFFTANRLDKKDVRQVKAQLDRDRVEKKKIARELERQRGTLERDAKGRKK
jgi:hypothetical protein